MMTFVRWSDYLVTFDQMFLLTLLILIPTLTHGFGHREFGETCDPNIGAFTSQNQYPTNQYQYSSHHGGQGLSGTVGHISRTQQQLVVPPQDSLPADESKKCRSELGLRCDDRSHRCSCYELAGAIYVYENGRCELPVDTFCTVNNQEYEHHCVQNAICACNWDFRPVNRWEKPYWVPCQKTSDSSYTTYGRTHGVNEPYNTYGRTDTNPRYSRPIGESNIDYRQRGEVNPFSRTINDPHTNYGRGDVNQYGQNVPGSNPYGQNVPGSNPYGQNIPGSNPYGGQNIPSSNPYGRADVENPYNRNPGVPTNPYVRNPGDPATNYGRSSGPEPYNRAIGGVQDHNYYRGDPNYVRGDPNYNPQIYSSNGRCKCRHGYTPFADKLGCFYSKGTRNYETLGKIWLLIPIALVYISIRN